MRALKQGVADIHDFLADGLEEAGAALRWQRAIGVEGGFGGGAGKLDIATRADREIGCDFLAARGGITPEGEQIDAIHECSISE